MIPLTTKHTEGEDAIRTKVLIDASSYNHYMECPDIGYDHMVSWLYDHSLACSDNNSNKIKQLAAIIIGLDFNFKT